MELGFSTGNLLDTCSQLASFKRENYRWMRRGQWDASVLCSRLLCYKFLSLSYSLSKCLWLRKLGMVLLTALKIVLVYKIGIVLSSWVPGVNGHERGAMSKF